MSVKKDTIQLDVIIGGNAAKKELAELDLKAWQLNEEMKGMKKNTAEYIAKTKELKDVQARMGALRKEIGLTGLTTKQLRAELKRLSMMEDHLTPGTNAFKENRKQLDAVKARLAEVKTGLGPFGRAWASVGQQVKAFGLLALGALGAQALLSGINNLIDRNYKLSDSFADVMKTTGFTEKQVKSLNDELGDINTRTARTELLALARDAGKLGKTGADVAKFVKEADMINVALGEDLGEDAILKMGKMQKIYRTGMLNIASSINTVGASSEASEGFLVDFMARMGGTAEMADIAAPSIIGYGATLDQMGMQVEMSGTAMNTFFIDFIKNTDKFEKAAGMQAGALKKLIGEKGTNEGFLAFLEQMKATSTGQDDFLRKLEQVGIDGSRGASVFLTLSNNLGMVREQQELATKSFAAGTSVIDEFNVKNNNFASVVDKLKKKLAGVFISPAVVSGMESMARGVLNLLDKSKALSDEYQAQARKVATLNTETSPLLAKYDKLMVEAVNNKEKQKELNDVLELLKKTVPLTAMEFDEYGRIMGVNTEKAREYIKQQQKINDLQTAEQFDEERKKLVTLNGEYKRLVALQDFLAKGGKSVGYGSKEANDINLTNKKLEETRAKIFESLTSIENMGREVEGSAIPLLTRWGDALDGVSESDFFKKETHITLNDVAKASGFIAKKSIEEKAEQSAALAQLNAGQLANELATMNAKLEIVETKEKELAAARASGLDTKAIEASLAAEKKLILSQIADLKQAIEAEGEPIDLVGDGNVLEKEVQNKLDKVREKIIDFQRQMENAQLSDNEKELAIISQKYTDAIKEAEGFYKEIGELRALKDLELAQKRREQLLREDNETYLLQLRLAMDKSRERLETEEFQTLAHKSEARERLFSDEVAFLSAETNIQLQNTKLTETEKTTIIQNFQQKRREMVDAWRQEDFAAYQDFTLEEKEFAVEAAQAKLDAVLSTDVAGQNRAKQVLQNAQMELLTTQTNFELANKNLTEEQKTLILQRFLQKRAEMTKKSLKKDADDQKEALRQLVDAFQDMFGDFLELASQADQQQMDAFLARQEKKKGALQNQLDQGIISQDEYNQRTAELDKEKDDKEKEFKKRQFERDRQLALVSAIINVARGVTMALASAPPPLNIFLAAITGAAGAIEIGTILSSQPPEMADGGMTDKILNGPSHNSPSRGMPIMNPKTGKIEALVEGGEAIVSRASVAANRDFVEMMLDSPGERVMAAQPQRPSMRTGRITRNMTEAMRTQTYADGGFIGKLQQNSPNASPSASADNTGMTEVARLLKEILKTNQELIKVTAAKNATLKAEVVLTGRNGLEEREKELADIKKLANL